MNLTYVMQDERLGLANAIYAGRHVVGNSTFAVIPGDYFFYPKTFMRDLREFHQKHGAYVTLGVTDIQDTTRHGIIAYQGMDVTNVVEKPSPEDAPGMKGSVGIYIINAEIFDTICLTEPGVNNEYQLADAFNLMIRQGRKVVCKDIPGYHIDVGTPKDLREANRLFYLREK